MIKISKFTCEFEEKNIVIDRINPRFSFYFECDNKTEIKSINLKINDWNKEIKEGYQIIYDGELKPFSKYVATLTVTTTNEEIDTKDIAFETGYLNSLWKANWISDKFYIFKEKNISPKPMIFHKKLTFSKSVKSIKIYSTALGIYDVYLENKLISNRYFAPGFTSYKHQLQYQCYDITNEFKNNNSLYFVVAGGWAVGSFIFTRQNRITAPRQALKAEIRVIYDDNTVETIITDESWNVTTDNQFLMADFYDGETYDANVNFSSLNFHNASIEKVKINPTLIAEYGSPVIQKEKFIPINKISKENHTIYDFGQNFAGLITINIKNAKKGQIITIKHAEILTKDNELNTSILRSAKATLKYICKDGKQSYSPRFTYMGFRYVSVEGINEEDYEIYANAIYSDIEQISTFNCSSNLINRLQENILWSAKSNFVDIPTDCPQRDERMGWTGDIALFAPTALYNFSMNRFLEKWLLDLKSEQLKTGGIPNTIPQQGYGFPTTMPRMAIDFWGDACILVPYAMYEFTGDINILKNMYDSMKKYVKACKFWANLLSIGHSRYIWKTPAIFHFGDWVAPDVTQMSEWQKRSVYTATCSLKNTSSLLSKIALILGNEKDHIYFKEISNKVDIAFNEKLTNREGKINKEFQTGYVLPIHFKMFNEINNENAVNNLLKLIKNNDYCIGTGFPGTPYILYSLFDNNRKEDALKMLMNTKCPSWLYEVKMGATTIWEKWDGLNELGECIVGDDGTGGMISYNHYASGAIGDFIYKRIAGLESIEPGFKSFIVKPYINNEITSCMTSTITPYGKIVVDWKYECDEFTIKITVPLFTNCTLYLPNGEVITLTHGNHEFKTKIKS